MLTMPLIDYNARVVNLRFALLGPAGAGKRTIVRQLHALSGATEAVEARIVAEMERLSFDFTPANVEALGGHRLQAEVFSLSGSAGPMWERLLNDLDAVLVVADSRPGAMAGNVAWLREVGGRTAIAEVPVVIFYNQRDLPECTAVAEMEAALNPLGALSFGGSGLTAAGLEPLLEVLVEMAFAARR